MGGSRGAPAGASGETARCVGVPEYGRSAEDGGGCGDG